ncbi:MAG: hypothetical protein NTW54_04515 [Bacteroidetes bacterium]|nr:hypothetical protein [Bacteroidota bacterium]
MLRKIAFVIYAIFCITCLNAQTSRYPVQEFFDDFDDGSFENWRVTNNADNQYFLSNSTYEMYRRSKKTAAMIFCAWKNPFGDFEIKLTFKFDKNKNKEQYAGVVLKANSSSAILAEVNLRKIIISSPFNVIVMAIHYFLTVIQCTMPLLTASHLEKLA